MMNKFTKKTIFTLVTVLVIAGVLLCNVGFHALATRGLWFIDFNIPRYLSMEGTLYKVSDACIDLLDKNGTFVPDGREKLSVEVTGVGKLKGLCSGDPASHEKESAGEMYTFSGSLLAIIQSSDLPGNISVTVKGKNIAPAEIILTAM